MTCAAARPFRMVAGLPRCAHCGGNVLRLPLDGWSERVACLMCTRPVLVPSAPFERVHGGKLK